MFSDLYVEAPKCRLAVRDYGGVGRAIVLVHGLSSNVCAWERVGPKLAEHHRVVAYDQRAHGLSSDGDDDFSFRSVVSDLEAVRSALALDDPIVVGHSWGASVALEHAVVNERCPGIVCVDGAVIDMQGLGATWEQAEMLLRPPRLIGPDEKVLARIRREQEGIAWEWLEPVIRRGRVPYEEGLTRPRLSYDAHMKIARQLWEQRPWELYDRVTCPVMVVVAGGSERTDRDRAFVALKRMSVERLLARKPDVRVEWVDSVHDVALANPDELVRLIDDFVQRV